MKISVVVDIPDEVWWKFVDGSHFRHPMRHLLSDMEDNVMAAIRNFDLFKEGTFVGAKITEDPVKSAEVEGEDG